MPAIFPDRTGTDPASERDVAVTETRDLIASDKVAGTEVFNRQGDRLGTIKNLMIDKRSGRVAYAVVSFGGFFGIGSEYHPLPWQALSYDGMTGGYIVDIDKDRLEGAPSFADDPTGKEWLDSAFVRKVGDFYGYGP